jgi:hypothetical protein
MSWESALKIAHARSKFNASEARAPDPVKSYFHVMFQGRIMLVFLLLHLIGTVAN